MLENKHKKFKDIWKVIAWLDDIRWNQKHDFFIIQNNYFKKMEGSEKSLVHWLCYITNRIRPIDQIWEKGAYIFSQLVTDYRKIETEEDFFKLFIGENGYLHNEKGLKMEKFQSKTNNDNKLISYAPRLPKDMYSILRTLYVLRDYNKSLFYYLNYHDDLWRGKKDALGRIAYLLYCLSYNDVKDIRGLTDKNKEGFKNEVKKDQKQVASILDEFDNNYHTWNKSKRYSNKRLWAALRDNLKLQTFSKAFQEKVLKKTRKEDLLSQLEFPGDIWNTRFAKHLLEPIIREQRIDGKKVFLKFNSSKSLRRMYDWMHKSCVDLQSFYPEQFDISFDFTPRMCEKRLCSVCPFGKNGSLSICLGECQSEDKLCPVALATSGYIHICNRNDCPIIQEIGKGTCEQNLT